MKNEAGESPVSNLTRRDFIVSTALAGIAAGCTTVNHESVPGTRAKRGRLSPIPSGLLCDDRANPLGIDNPAPCFSFHWEKPPDGKTPEVPALFRVRVSRAGEPLQDRSGDLWNSGWRSSDGLLRVTYAGEALQTGKRYHWCVETQHHGDVMGASSSTAWFEMGLLAPADWKADWIMGVAETFTKTTSDLACGYRHTDAWETDWVNENTRDYEGESPLLRREFTLDKPVRRARLYFCGLGWSEAWINGRKVSDDVHSPAFTDYDEREPGLTIGHAFNLNVRYRGRRHRVLYRIYDVTDMLRTGPNALGLWLGNGYWNDPLQRKGAKPRAICQLEITCSDGTRLTIGSSPKDWKTAASPILYNEMVLGEVYDARRELVAWSSPDFDASTWGQAYPAAAPRHATLQAQTFPADKVVRTYAPELIAQYRDGVRIYDIGDQIAGWVKISVRGSGGDRVDVRFAQTCLRGELAPMPGKISKLTYILRGEGLEDYTPRFMYAGFRYFEVATSATIVHLEAQRVEIEVPHTGHFECSEELWNRLYRAAVNTMSSHFQAGLALDDVHLERRCYTGTVAANSYWGSISFDAATLYKRWLVDLADAQHLELGCFPDTVPFQDGGGNLYQGIPILDVPYELYLHTGDKDILAAYLEPMQRWMCFLETCTNGDFLIHRIYEGWPFIGDWLWPGHWPVKPGSVSAIESDDYSKSYVNSCLYAHAVGRLVEILQILGKDASSYVALKANISRAIRDKWFDPKTHTFAGGRHGAEALALWAGIVPPEQQQAVAAAMARHIVADCDGHLDTGMYSTLRLLAMLTRYHHQDVAAGIMRKTTYPSLGFMIRNGQTTLLEYFEGIRNYNQPIFATYVEWMLTDVLGIRPDLQKPGYRNIILSPMLLDELAWVRGRLQTPRGMVQVRWERSPEQVLLRAQIPLGSTAQVRVPPKMQRVSVDGARVQTFEKDGGRWVQVASGEHTVVFRNA